MLGLGMFGATAEQLASLASLMKAANGTVNALPNTNPSKASLRARYNSTVGEMNGIGFSNLDDNQFYQYTNALQSIYNDATIALARGSGVTVTNVIPQSAEPLPAPRYPLEDFFDFSFPGNTPGAAESAAMAVSVDSRGYPTTSPFVKAPTRPAGNSLIDDVASMFSPSGAIHSPGSPSPLPTPSPYTREPATGGKFTNPKSYNSWIIGGSAIVGLGVLVLVMMKIKGNSR